jgi:ketosteroid isomerase-like protein
MNSVETVLAFIDTINRHEAEKLVELMTDDHVLIDALGNSLRGRENLRAGWQAYFAMCPDYWIVHDEIFHSGDTIALFGSAGGTIRGCPWQTPAAWRAVVHGGRIQEWRVYAENKPVYDILARSGEAEAR